MPCFSCFSTKKSNDDKTDVNIEKNKEKHELNNMPSKKQTKQHHTNKAFVDDTQVVVATTNTENKIDNETFKKFLVELGLADNQIENLLKLPDESKLKLIQSKQKTTSVSEEPANVYVESIKKFILKQEELVKQIESEDEDEISMHEKCLKCLEDLKLALRIQPMSFVTSFLELGGLDTLLEFLNKLNPSLRESQFHYLLLTCIKTLMNNSKGRVCVLTHETGINIITQSLYKSNNKIKTLVLEILGAICFLSDNDCIGHEKAFNSMKYYKIYAKERFRFQSLVNNLDEDTEDSDGLNLKIATMSFINALLCRGCGEKIIEYRLHVRYEFLMLGIQTLVDKLRSYNNKTLNKHLDYFEATRYDDEYNYACLFNETHINTKSATVMFDLICRRLAYSTSYVNWLSILHHLLLATIKEKIDNTNFWCMIDSIIQQIVLQLSESKITEQDSFKIDINQILIKSNKESEIEGLKVQIDTQQSDIDDFKNKLSKKEKEYGIMFEENETLKSNLNKLKLQYDEEIAKTKELEIKLQNFEQNLNKTTTTKFTTKIEQRRQIASLIDQQVPSTSPKTSTTTTMMFADSVDTNSETSKSLPIPIPQPPPSAPPAPPPLPFSFSSGGGPSSPKTNKNIPKAKIPMKCFNWNKLPLNSYDRTLWKNVNDEKMYKIIDLDDFEKTFSAYQKSNDENLGLASSQNSINFTSLTNSNNPTSQQARSLSNSDLTTKPGSKQNRRDFSVIDFTRSRNCTILLSKLRMSNNELKNILISMDPKDELPKDMIEQLLKFIPTAEEEALLEENRSEVSNMAKADRFLYDMSKIFRYKQKLDVLYFKKKYLERYKEICLKVEKMTKCCQMLKQNKNVLELLEIVLALGNFMNQSHKKGVAVGFSIANLNKLIDIKSSNDRTYSMLHFLVTTIQEKFPHLINLPEELHGVIDVAKTNFENLEIEWTSLETGFDELEKEIEIHLQSKDNLEGYDQFIKLANDFHDLHSDEVHELKKNFLAMKNECSTTMKYFGEDENKMKYEEFFSIWNTFLQSFNEAKNELKVKKQRELDEKKHKEDTSLKLKNKPSLSISTKNVADENNSEFDSLVSAIISGNAFNKRNGGNNRRKPSTSNQHQYTAESLRFNQRERILSQD